MYLYKSGMYICDYILITSEEHCEIWNMQMRGMCTDVRLHVLET